MEQEPGDKQIVNLDKPLLTNFLHNLSISRRKLSLYPPGHPQVLASINVTMDILNELFHSNPIITFGIAPGAIYFEQLWLDKEDSINREFANFFSALGVASVSFHSGLTGSELIRFNQLLHSNQNTREPFTQLAKKIDQQQINHIAMIPIDYDAFQSNQLSSRQQPADSSQLWETFLHGLHHGILDFDDSGSALDLNTVAAMLNQKLLGDQTEREQSSRSIENFIESRVQQKNDSPAQSKTDKKLVALLEQLTPGAQQKFLNKTFHALDRHRDTAPDMLQQIPAQILKNTIDGKNHQDLNLSSRLFSLISSLANTSNQPFQHNIKNKAVPLSNDMVRARLKVLFSEEQQDLYMPDNYQAAIHNILNADLTSNIPEKEKLQLKAQIETQAIEHNCAAIIFELLDKQLDSEQEESIQQNLIDLSRYFLDSGDFVNLLKIHSNWSKYLYSNNSSASIFDEKVLSSHAQPTFMAEVLDCIDLWEEEKVEEIADYIVGVGDPYIELIVEQLGLAPKWSQRQLWMSLLERIGGNARPIIVRSLNDERWFLVRNLLIVLGKNLDQSNIKVIHRLIRHPHPKVRLEVMRNLFSCNPATANRQLLQELQSEDPEARFSAVQIADLSRDPAVLSLLHNFLGIVPNNDTKLELNKQTIKTLTRIGNKDSLPILRRILQKHGLLVPPRIKQLQVEIFQNLTLFPGTSVDKLLHELANSKHRQLAKQTIEQRQNYLRRGK